MPSSPPLVLSMLICDAIHRDPGTGKHTLLGIFNVIRVSKFPSMFPTMSLYISLTEVIGEYPVHVQIIDADEERDPIYYHTGNLKCKDPLQVVELAIPITNVTYPRLGEYRIRVFVGDEMIGTRKITVKETGPSPSI